MSVVIIREDYKTIYVNAKLCILDGRNNWVFLEELNTAEEESFKNYIQSEKLNMKNRLN